MQNENSFKMKWYSLFIVFFMMHFVSYPAYGMRTDEIRGYTESNIDTIRIVKGNNYLYFEKPVLGISHIHFLGKGMRCLEPASFSQNDILLDMDTILSNIYGVHEIPNSVSEPLRINDVVCNDMNLRKPDTTVYRTYPVIYNAYFEDMFLEANDAGDCLIVNNIITCIPVGYAKYELLLIKNQLFVIQKVNIDGVLYTEWFRFGDCERKPLDLAWQYATHGIGTGFKHAKQGIEKGIRRAKEGIGIGVEEAGRGIGIGGKQAAQGSTVGLESAVSGIGRAVFNESKMFYRPSKVLDDMDGLIYEEKAIEVERGIIVYTYFFKSKYPKANIFLIHGNGGNVSTYKQMIQTLVLGQYNVYAVDWRGYGKSTGRPDYRGVLKDTEAAFDDFLSLTRGYSLPVIVYGMSLGGQVATKLVSDRQQDVDAFVLDGSLSSAQNLVMDFMPEGLLSNSLERSKSAFNQEYIAEEDIRGITNIPKLIVHSESDNVILFYHGERLYENAREPKAFWRTDTPHIRTLEDLPDEAIEKIDRLIRYNRIE